MAKLSNIIERERSLWKTLGFVLRESYHGSKKYSIMRYVAASLVAVFVVAQFGAFGLIVNEFVTYGIAGARVAMLIKGFILLLVTQFGPDLFNLVHDYAWQMQNQALSRHLQSEIFKKMDHLDIGTIEQPELQNIREISTNRGWNSFYSIIDLFSVSFRNISRLVAAGIVIISISPIAFFIIFLGSLPTYFFESKNAKLSAKIHKENSESWRMWRSKTDVINSKDKLTELKNFSIVNIFRKKFLAIIGGIHEKVAEVYKKKLMSSLVVQGILAISFGIAFYILIHNVFIGVLAIGSLVFSFGAVTQFQMAINALLSSFGRMSEHKKNVDILLDLLEMEPLIVSGNIVIKPEDFRTLEIKNVSFRYPGSEKDVLHGLNLTITFGENLAIVGLNGAGKSTLLKLITRVYDPTEGEILVNGINLKEYDLESWKRCLGILLQEYALYSEETISENIMLGDVTKHDQSLVEQSAIDTTADGFIRELAEKYNQRVGTEFRGGVELSKGQKQKTALARVLYRRAPVLILDEPTASVDALSEDSIFKSLRENHQEQTRIIISHKFSNVRDSDEIILIEYGSIIERGNHGELMKMKKGKYKELFELQAEGYK
jgi:ABC-type multidrug transport system fused ATPase/permease subunit